MRGGVDFRFDGAFVRRGVWRRIALDGRADENARYDENTVNVAEEVDGVHNRLVVGKGL